MPLMNIAISKNKTQSNFIEIEMNFLAESETVFMQLPAWRPGRYELQNFSKNIQFFQAYDQKNNLLSTKKISKECWEISSPKGQITVKYSYYANKIDAGNTYIDENVFYINFVNCIPHLVGEMDSPITLSIDLPEDWAVASALKFKKNTKSRLAIAKSYYELYDSPTIASLAFDEKKYKVGKVDFSIQIIGNYLPNWSKIMPSFKSFSELQIQIMGDFPVENYNFIIWIIPNAFYHGVEHGSSTMIVLGPDNEGDSLLSDLLGVSSHELFHAWNICKIRPKNLLPYDFSKENYFDTGFVVEGVTTYLGDLFLLHAGVISKDEYLKELSAISMRHFVKDDKACQSIVESSIDLWVDGYTEGIPNKKVSIYNKGALLALILDLKIRNRTKHTFSLYTIMKEMWEKFGKFEIGYLLSDYKLIAENIYGESLVEYFSACIFGNISLEKYLNMELKNFGLKLIWKNQVSTIITEIKNPTEVQKLNLRKFLTNNTLATI
jgi:predicted metalloprotease with PDZ domain